MSNNLTTFEVRVKVKGKQPRDYYYSLGKYIYDETIKMFHIDARTPQQAKHKAERYGRPISVRKVDMAKLDGNTEHFPLMQGAFETYSKNNPYASAVAMDELIWQKRNKRRKNLEKDKEKDLTTK